MNAWIVSFAVSLLLFVVMTVRIQQARARAAVWRKVAIAAGVLAAIVFMRSRKGVEGA